MAKVIDKSELIEGLARFGYPLFKQSVAGGAEKLLERLLGENDGRLLEGFPVVFLDALRDEKRTA
jgi:hypothetical protein